MPSAHTLVAHQHPAAGQRHDGGQGAVLSWVPYRAHRCDKLPSVTTHVAHPWQYFTCVLFMPGKWGLGDHGSTGYPLAMGWDEFYGYDSQVSCHDWYPAALWRQNDSEPIPQNAGRCAVLSEDLFVNESITFIGDAAERARLAEATGETAQPFFLFVSFVSPHAGYCTHSGPNEPSGTYAVPYEEPQYASKSWSKTFRDYASAITRVDRDVGKILSALEHAGLDSNTLVMFSSDNGAEEVPHTFFDSCGQLRGFKRAVLEGGMRAPLIARWPGVVPEGARSDYQANFYDLLPTLADVAGVDPAELPPALDGASYLKTLSGDQQPQPESHYWEFCHQASQ